MLRSSSSRRTSSVLAAAAAGLLLAASLGGREPSPVAARGTPSGTLLALMKELSTGCERIEDGLSSADPDAWSRAAREMHALLRGTAWPERPDAGGGFDALRERLEVTLGELAGLGSAQDLGAARQAFGEARTTCVTCHVKHRDDNAARGLYPALENVVSGRVELKDVEGEALEDRAWVLVFLERDAPDPVYPAPRQNPVLDQRERGFNPRVLPVVRGTTIDFPNDDSIFHNVFSLSKAKPFDLGVYEPGDSRSVTMDRTGLVNLYCNIHPEMSASIVVLGNPYFDLTDAEGRFVITDVPDGHWTLRAWNDLGAELRLELALADREWRELSLHLSESKRIVPHKNKFGLPYRQKYR